MSYVTENTTGLPPEAVAKVMEKRRLDALRDEKLKIDKALSQVRLDISRASKSFPDLTDPDIFKCHWDFLCRVAEDIVLAPQRRKFVVDDNNNKIIIFLLYYFNNCSLAEQIFPDKRFKLAKPLLIRGDKGVGKTFLMQLFSEYLRRTNNPNSFSMYRLLKWSITTPSTTTSTDTPTTTAPASRKITPLMGAAPPTYASTTLVCRRRHSSGRTARNW